MSKFKHYVGIDVSKAVFDVALLESKKYECEQFENTKEGVLRFVRWLKKLKLKKNDVLICMEHTGTYCKPLTDGLTKKGFNVWLEVPRRISLSMGMQRGKNDKVDATRIAHYASRNSEDVVLYKAPRKVVQVLHKLFSIRDLLIKTRTSLTVAVKEYSKMDEVLAEALSAPTKQTLAGIEEDLAEVQRQIDECLEDEQLKPLYQRITSVIGVGQVTAIYIICVTNEFTMYRDPRKLACYAGVAPFEYSSGSSVRGKTKVHHMANKKLKSLLSQCARCAVQHDPELKAYYQRKLAEGKNKMQAQNNVRNKLVHRICACLINERLYERREVA